MTTDKITAARFAEIIAAYGADPRRWPPPEREAALAMRSALSAEARETLATETRLDSLLAPVQQREERIHAASAGLRARIAAVPFAETQTRETAATPSAWAWAARLLGFGGDSWTPRALAPTAAMLALVAALGFAAGYRGVATPWIDGAQFSADILSLDEENLLPLSEDRS